MEPCTILLVDDDDAIRETVADALQDDGHHVVQASNGQEALDVLRSMDRAPNAILLDLMMPVMDGPAFREQQVASEAWRDIPVILFSADAAAKVKARDLAVQEVLIKPVKLASLLAVIARYC